MEFNRKDLLAATERAIADVATRDQRRYERELEKHEQSKIEWLGLYADEWRRALPGIQAKLDAGEPITPDDAPGDRRWGSRPVVFAYDEPKFRSTPAPSSLLSLAATLRTIADDTVTPNGLKNVGVTPSTLREAFRFMGQEEAD